MCVRALCGVVLWGGGEKQGGAFSDVLRECGSVFPLTRSDSAHLDEEKASDRKSVV